jgi:hypothetical protein
MSRAAVEQLPYAMDQAFDGGRWPALLGNLGAVTAEDWVWRPPNGERTIQDIVRHVGGCKLMYQNHAFGDRALRWTDPLVRGVGAIETIPSAVAWLRAGQAQLRSSVAALDDAGLFQLRPAPWNESFETRWLVGLMAEHDLYHAGEINHLRALRHGDRWA